MKKVILCGTLLIAQSLTASLDNPQQQVSTQPDELTNRITLVTKALQPKIETMHFFDQEFKSVILSDEIAPLVKNVVTLNEDTKQANVLALADAITDVLRTKHADIAQQNGVNDFLLKQNPDHDGTLRANKTNFIHQMGTIDEIVKQLVETGRTESPFFNDALITDLLFRVRLSTAKKQAIVHTCNVSNISGVYVISPWNNR